VLAVALLQGCAARPEAPAAPAPATGFHQIMAEIAADRGVSAAAAGEYLNAAERSDDPQFSQRAAEFAFDNGFDGYALRAARRWTQLEPDSASAQLYVARLMLRRNDIAAAAAATAQALGPPEARDEEDYALLADELAEEDNSEGVTRVMTRLAARAPPSLQLQLALAAAALRSAEPDLAEFAARQAIAAGAVDEDLDQAQVILARVLLARGDADGAISQIGARIEARPSLDLELEYAGLMAAAGRQQEAATRLELAMLQYGREPSLRRLDALIKLNANELKAAWEAFATLADDPDFADESRFHMAEIALREAQFDQALKMLGRVGDGPYLVPAQESIARIAEASGDAQSALGVLDRLAERYPGRAFAAARLKAATLQRLERNDEALAILDEILRYRPYDADVLLIRGALLEKMQRLEPALADMAAAVRLYPDSAVANNALGYTLVNRTKRLSEAYRLVRRALEREPSSAAILDSYGWVLYRQGRLPQARSYLQFAYAKLPDPEVAAHLGEVMWKQGEREAAQALWADALEKSPDSRPLAETMARFAP